MIEYADCMGTHRGLHTLALDIKPLFLKETWSELEM